MALIGFTGFEASTFPPSWTPGGAAALVQSTTARSGTYACEIGNEQLTWGLHDWDLTTETMYLGFAFRKSSENSASVSISISAGTAGSWYELHCRFETNGQVNLYAADSIRGTDSLLGSTATGRIQVDTWYYVELVFYPDDSTGVGQLWVDGLQEVNFSGDTAIDGNANRSNAQDDLNIYIDGASLSDFYIDDVYLCTDTASGNDPFTGRQGDLEVEALTPDGTTAQQDFTVTGAATRHEAVQDIPETTGQYNSSATATDEDRLTVSNRTHTGTPLAVAYHLTGQKDADNTRNINSILTSGAVADEQGPFGLANGTSTTFTNYYAVNPDTGVPAWTNTSVNAIEIGYSVD